MDPMTISAIAGAVSSKQSSNAGLFSTLANVGSQLFTNYKNRQMYQQYMDYQKFVTENAHQISGNDLMKASAQTGLSPSMLMGISPAQSNVSAPSNQIAPQLDMSQYINAQLEIAKLAQNASQFKETADLTRSSQGLESEKIQKDYEVRISELNLANEKAINDLDIANRTLSQQREIADSELSYRKKIDLIDRCNSQVEKAYDDLGITLKKDYYYDIEQFNLAQQQTLEVVLNGMSSFISQHPEYHDIATSNTESVLDSFNANYGGSLGTNKFESSSKIGNVGLNGGYGDTHSTTKTVSQSTDLNAFRREFSTWFNRYYKVSMPLLMYKDD